MSTSPSSIPKVRTYAADLNSMRGTKSSASTNPSPTPVPVVTETKAEQTIPPFHTFSKNETVTATPAAPSSPIVKPVAVSNAQTETQKILTASSTPKGTGELKESMPAVIITDTKRKRFKLSEAIVTSVQDWWNNKKQTAQQKKIPKYTVPVAERRKGVIQKATAKTGRESSADHTAVLTRIKATKQIPHATTVPAAPLVQQEPATPLWESAEPTPVTPRTSEIVNQRVVKRQSSTRESTVPTLNSETLATHSWETDIQAKANALAEPVDNKDSRIILTGKEFTKIKEARASVPVAPTILPITPPVPVTTERAIKPMIPPQIVNVPANESLVFVAPTPIVRTQIPPVPVTPPEAIIPTPYTRPKIEPIVPVAPQSSAPAVSVTPIASVQVAPPVAPAVPEQKREERRFAPPREQKRDILSMFRQTNRMVFITLGILIFVVGSGLGLRAYQNAPAQIEDPTVPVVNTVFPGSATYTETNFYTNKTQLSDRLKTQSSDADSLVEITFLNENGQPLTAPDFLTLFDASVPFDFVASINNIRLGNYRGAPWILLTISDKNTALGGMLAWEGTMGRNLAPIFSSTIATSYPRFTDSIINGIDVRIMKNSEGNEEIVYGFVGYDTLLITSNTTAFLNLAQKIY